MQCAAGNTSLPLLDGQPIIVQMLVTVRFRL